MRFIFLLLFLICALNTFATGREEKDAWGINSGFESEGIARKTQELGASWSRMTIYWDQVETSKGVFNWSVPDTVISRAIKAGLNVYAIIHSAPRWANGNKESRVPPRKVQDWSDFVKAVAERYADDVRAYGMWNEPNVEKFWGGNRKEYISKILAPGFNAAKAADPDVLILGPELSHHWTEQSDWRLWDIMKDAQHYIDIVALHYYPDARFELDDYLDRWVKAHRKGKPVWITEIGLSLCDKEYPGENEVRKKYLQFFQIQRERNEWFTKIFPYRIWDPAEGCDDGNGFGLTFGDDMRERPIYQMYQNLIQRWSGRSPSKPE